VHTPVAVDEYGVVAVSTSRNVPNKFNCCLETSRLPLIVKYTYAYHVPRQQMNCKLSIRVVLAHIQSITLATRGLLRQGNWKKFYHLKVTTVRFELTIA